MEETARKRGVDEPLLVPTEEMAETLRFLSVDQMRRIERYARKLCWNRNNEADELIGSAFEVIMKGDRSCKRGTDPMGFVNGVMRSELSNEARKQARLVPLGDDAAAGPLQKEATFDPRDDQDTQEEDEKAYLDRMQARLEELLVESDDGQCFDLYLGRKAGLRGSELAKELGVDQSELPTIQRRFKRLVERLKTDFPRGNLLTRP